MRMLTHRRRGLANLYIIIISLLMTVMLWAYARALPLLPRIRLSPGVDLLPYGGAVFLGMLWGAGTIRQLGGRFMRLSWLGCLVLACRQMFYVGAFIFALMFIAKDRAVSRLFLGTYLVCGVVFLAIIHGGLPRMLAAWVFSQRSRLTTVLVGRSAAMDRWMKKRAHLGVDVIGFLSDSDWPEMAPMQMPYLGPVGKLQQLVRDRRINQVILVEWPENSEQVDRLIEICEAEGCRFLVHNDYSSQFARSLTPVEEDGAHFLALQNEPLEDPVNRALKRGLDIAVSLPVVVFILPVLTAIIWLVQRWQAPGPVFFNRPRGGRNRTTFGMFKYRSMYVSDHDINQQAQSGDDRVYPLGRLLRKASLDEFPQFLNVLRGEMSVVGPRPHLPKHDEQFSQIARAYRTRSLVKPGITGLAQVKGFRGEITDPAKLHSRVYMDLYYVAHWSIVMDLRIIFLTAWQVIFPPKTAY